MANEKRLIRYEDVFQYAFKGANGGDLEDEDFDAIINAIEAVPTVDAVEVVRCKDCRWSRTKDHREPTDTSRRLICQCFKHHHIPAPWGARLAVEPEDFCSYGERRTDGKYT